MVKSHILMTQCSFILSGLDHGQLWITKYIQGAFPFGSERKNLTTLKAQWCVTYQIVLFDVLRCKAVSKHTELGLVRDCWIQNLRTIQSSYCSVIWSSENPNSATKRTSLNKRRAQYIYIRIYIAANHWQHCIMKLTVKWLVTRRERAE